MSIPHTIVTRSRRHSVLFVVIAALFVVPPIVRATARIKSSSPIRLNRGFETPPSKGDVVASLEPIAASASTHEPERPPVRPQLRSRDDARPVVVPSERAPDPQRGPPAVTLR
jgi:hypothetical protein